MASSSSVKVAVRVRPLNQREVNVNSNVIVHMEGKQTTLETIKYSNVDSNLVQDKNKTKSKRFVYDYSYWSAERNDRHYASQAQVFKDLGVLVLDAAFEGYNACVFAYGQTGAGKTYTMMGEKNDPGLIPRICEGLYSHVSNSSNKQESFKIEVSYLEIYNEQVMDLLRPTSHKRKNISPTKLTATRLRVREHPKNGPYVQGLTKHDAPDYVAIEAFLNQGNHLRKTASTRMNNQSSRSHAIFTIKFTQAKFVAGLPSEITSKIHLVDLAGSERVSKSGATGDRLKEGGNINKSLTTLGIVISTLAERSSQTDPTQRKLFIPYRDSTLTWLLKDSLGGNSKTIMIAAISPSDSSYGETLSTLRYADRAKNIINVPTVNEDPNVKLIRELKNEIERLKAIITGDRSQIRSSLTIENVDMAQRLLEGTESKMEKHLRNWADKWRDTLHIIEESDLGLQKHGSTLRIDVDPPHLVLLDNDVLNTSITIFSLKEGDNLIGNVNAADEQDIEFDDEDIKNEHCFVTYESSNVMLIPRKGGCQVNQKPINEPMKLSQGDIILLGQDVRLKFNFPQEASFLREKRKTGFFSESEATLKSLQFSSTPVKPEAREQPLSPVTDESGVELDIFEDDEDDKMMMDELKRQVQELLTKYKQSEIERVEAETRNKMALEEKEKEIKNQAMELLELQKNNEAVLQNHQSSLQALREQLSEEKNNIRAELKKQMEEVFGKFRSTNSEIMDDSRKDFERYKESFYEQLKMEWTKLDQYEMKLIEIEAEKRKTVDEAETRLKKERVRSEENRQRCLEDIEHEKRKMQDVLEGHLEQLGFSRKDYEEKEKDADKCGQRLENDVNTFVSQIRELEWLQYKLCREEDTGEMEDVSEVVQTVKAVTKDIEALESDREKDKEKLFVAQAELCESDRALKYCEGKVEECKSKMVAVRKKFVECQQRFGEELGDIVNSINTERDAELEKIESDREVLLSKHLEHQRSMEVLVNEGLEKIGEENEPKINEIKERVARSIRCSSPGLERNSLQSQIVDEKVLVHHQQMNLGENEKERMTLHDEEGKFLAIREEVQSKREEDQRELSEKIKALQLLVESKGEDAEITADYLESESFSLMKAQRDIVGVDKELTAKIWERRQIEKQIENAKFQMELQAESSQEQYEEVLEELQRRAKEKEEEIEKLGKVLQEKTDQYLTRLRRESFVVLEQPLKTMSSYMKMGNEAADEILNEIAMASHVPELAITYTSMMQDCGGWRYEEKEKEVDLLQKQDTKDAIHSFLGRGIIRASPQTIIKEVSNPASRFIYDRMLKNIRIIENVADDLKIVYMLHETTRCFIKHSRDFCFLALTKEKDGKLIVACQSVDHANCPEVKGILRAKILSSGWVVEPVTIGGQTCSLVWYLTRVYLGKSLPSKLVNLVSKRQPLSVAYLRDYLVPGT